MNATSSPRAQISTGIEGLDSILKGGLPRGETCLVYGDPGAGKTTLGLQFVLDGARNQERALFITLSQREDDLHLIARSHGWSLDGVDIREISQQSVAEHLAGQQSVLRTADVELGEMTLDLRDAIEAARPVRVVFDSIGALRALAGGEGARYRQEIALLLRFLSEQGVTTLLLDEAAQHAADPALQTLVHGVMRLTKVAPAYGEVRRQLQVEKMRGLNFNTGWHNFQIRVGGLEVFPRLRGTSDATPAEWRTIRSGVEKLDGMLGGGLEAGSACLVVGAAGTGKSTFSTLFAHTALLSGEGAAIFLFDEHRETFLRRSDGLNMDLRGFLENGQLHLQSIDTGEISPGEFAQMLRQAIDQGARVVVIDSLTGYYHSMREEQLLPAQMHEMLFYMASRGVLGLLVVAQHGLFGSSVLSPTDISYMADSVVLLRNFEARGAVRLAISVIKKRYGSHERAIHELKITEQGLEVGDVLREMDGVLTGSPSDGEGRQ